MIKVISLIVVLLLSFSAFCQADRIRPNWDREAQLGQPLFVVSTVKRLNRDADKVRIDVIVEVVNDMLLFVRRDDKFTASFDLTLSVLAGKKGQVISRFKNITKTVSDYDLTNSRSEYASAVFSVELEPAKYKIKVLLEDKESRKREKVEKSFIVESASSEKSIDLSDLILTRSRELDEKQRIPVHPTVYGVVPEPASTLFCFFDLFRANPALVTTVFMDVREKSGEIVYSDTLMIVSGDGLTSYFLPIPCHDLSFNRYEIELSAVQGDDTLRSAATFAINFYGLPWIIRDLDQAIKQLRQIATPEEIRQLSNVFPSKKEKAFIKFWNDNFSTDQETVNGKMVEYYNRVNYTIMYFSNNREGWETDRGKVFIIYGKPSEIEKSESGNTQYETWIYNRLNRSFVFKDEFGFGEFRLLSQIW